MGISAVAAVGLDSGTGFALGAGDVRELAAVAVFVAAGLVLFFYGGRLCARLRAHPYAAHFTSPRR